MSVEKLVSLDKDSLAAYEKKFGRWNQLPPNFKPITEVEFAASKFFIYAPRAIEYRQLSPPVNTPSGKVYELRLYTYYDDTGLAIAVAIASRRVAYFSFAVCEHDMRHTKKLDNCLNRYTCAKCGYANDIDSSD